MVDPLTGFPILLVLLILGGDRVRELAAVRCFHHGHYTAIDPSIALSYTATKVIISSGAVGPEDITALGKGDERQ